MLVKQSKSAKKVKKPVDVQKLLDVIARCIHFLIKKYKHLFKY